MLKDHDKNNSNRIDFSEFNKLSKFLKFSSQKLTNN